MKVDLQIDDLRVIQVAIESLSIKGKDAPVIAKLLSKISKAFEKEVVKQNG